LTGNGLGLQASCFCCGRGASVMESTPLSQIVMSCTRLPTSAPSSSVT
jgi:hypothetical protein